MPYDPTRHRRRSIRLPGYDYTQTGYYFVTICTYERQHLFDDLALRRIAEQQWQALMRAGQRGQSSGRVDLDAWVVMPNHVHGIIVMRSGSTASSSTNNDHDVNRNNNGTRDNNAVGAQQVHPKSSTGAVQNERGKGIHDRSTNAPAAPLRRRHVSDDVNNIDENGLVDQDRGLGINVAPGSLGAIIRSYKASVARRINHLRRTPSTQIWQRGYWERIVRDDRQLEATRRYIAANPSRWAADRDNLDALLARMNAKD